MSVKHFMTVRFYVLTTVNIRMTVIRAVVPLCVTPSAHDFALHHLMMEAVRTSETSVYSETTRRIISEGSNLHTRRRGSLKSHMCLSYYHHGPIAAVSPQKSSLQWLHRSCVW
jgi:hypothetical protein